MGWKPVLLTIVVLAACGGLPSDPKAEMQSAIENYLSGRGDISLGSVKVTVDSVSIEDDNAQTEVTIAATDDPQAKMQMVYDLVKRSGHWRVKNPEPAGGPNSGAPPTQGTSTLPPGHPPTNTPRSDLPPGHPPVGGSEAPSAGPHANIPM